MISGLSHRHSQLIAWQGFRIWVPDSWNPVKVDGDWNQGTLLLADMQQAKLGIRWRVQKSGDPAKWAARTMRSEVGELAAKEAKDWSMSEPDAWKASRLFIEPKPPGRDVWIGWSSKTDRVLEIVHHAKERDRVLSEQVLEVLDELTSDVTQDWSIFDISCKTPAGWQLQWYRLNAGDLTLAFQSKRKTARIRQLAPASLALARQSLEKWMQQQDKTIRRLYRPMSQTNELSIDVSGREVQVRKGVLKRKRRFFWAFTNAREITVYGLHDENRNRITIVQGDDEQVLKELLGSSGWARKL